MTLSLRLLAVAIACAMVASATPITAQPTTVYEEPDVPPQAMDFDAENNMFKAHSGWIQDKLVHYYKFRMYVPPNYNPGTAAGVPVMPAYLPSTDGTMAGAADQSPILPHHTGAGADWDPDYSDFVEIHFVDVGSAGEGQGLHSVADITDGGFETTPSGIYVNMPVVPTGSTLEDPIAKGTAAPIEPWTAWFDEEEVQVFVFETTDADFADYINPITRVGAASDAGSGYESVVAPNMMAGSVPAAIPIWHVNQYFTGVTPGVNNGGPADMGQRNVIDMDRLDAGYSPLWQVWWATQIPIGYGADQASNAAQFTEENGFKIAKTPMFVNCPNIGPHGGFEANHDKVGLFEDTPDVEGEDSFTIEGALIMRGGKAVSVHINGDKYAETTTGMMGAYSFEIPVSELDGGENTIQVVYDDADDGPHTTGSVPASYTVLNGEAEPEAGGNDTVVWIIIVVALVVLVYAYGRMKKPQ